jgi:hypothetical protein
VRGEATHPECGRVWSSVDAARRGARKLLYSGAMKSTGPTASQADRDYFARVARANAAIGDEDAPTSLDAMFDRLEEIRRRLGPLATPGVSIDDDDLAGHLEFLARLRRQRVGGTDRA